MQIIQAQECASCWLVLNRQERGRGELSAIQEVERDGMPVVSIVSRGRCCWNIWQRMMNAKAVYLFAIF
jgi:hypothetical protein